MIEPLDRIPQGLHAIPVHYQAVAGFHRPHNTENLQLLCAHCNRVKGDRLQEYLVARIGDRSVILSPSPAAHKIEERHLAGRRSLVSFITTGVARGHAVAELTRFHCSPQVAR